MIRPPPSLPLFPYTTLFRSAVLPAADQAEIGRHRQRRQQPAEQRELPVATERVQAESESERGERQKEEAEQRPDKDADRKSTRLNSSHMSISYAVFCLKKKK